MGQSWFDPSPVRFCIEIDRTSSMNGFRRTTAQGRCTNFVRLPVLRPYGNPTCRLTIYVKVALSNCEAISTGVIAR